MSAPGNQDFPQSVLEWVKEHPEHVQSWMSDPEFRRNLLDDPGRFGFAPDAVDWINERVGHHGVDKIVGGGSGGTIVAM